MAREEDEEITNENNRWLTVLAVVVVVGVLFLLLANSLHFFVSPKIEWKNGERERIACWAGFVPYKWVVLTPENKTTPFYMMECGWLSHERTDYGNEYVVSDDSIYTMESMTCPFIYNLGKLTLFYNVSFTIVSLEDFAPHLVIYRGDENKPFFRQKIQVDINNVLQHLIANHTYPVFASSAQTFVDQVNWSFLLQKYGVNITKVTPEFCLPDLN